MATCESVQGRALQRLNPKTQRFVAEYLKDLNGTQAAIRAGYAPSSARVRASKMLSNVIVAEAIREAQTEILRSNQVTVERIVRELALIAFFDPASMFDENGRLYPINELPPEIRRGLPAIEIVEAANGARRMRFGGKLAALLALGKHMAMFSNRIGDDPTDLPTVDPDSRIADAIDGPDEEVA
jgi:phage terminase small subunit